MINSISEMHGTNVDWPAVGKRIQEVRTAKNLDVVAASEEIGYPDGTINILEKGHWTGRKCANVIFAISQAWDVSLNWLLNGIGDCHGTDPVELIPETLIVQKGAGIRRAASRKDGEEGSYDSEAMEFVMAIDKYVKVNDIPFPSKTEIFDLFLALGYRKCVTARIAPLGYNVEHQKKSEQFNRRMESGPVSVPKESVLISEQSLQYNKGWATIDSTEKKVLLSRLFILTDPKERVHTVSDLLKFCNENGLNAARMYEAASSLDSKPYRNWRARLVYTRTKEAAG